MIELAIVIIIISVLTGLVLVAHKISLDAKLAFARSLTKSSPVTNIDNLALWFETTMPKSIVDLEADDGKSISVWYDLSPNRDNATVVNSPTYIAESINGLPTLRFDGSNDYLTFGGSSLINNNYTIFIVEQRRASTASGAYIIGGSGVTDNSRLNIGYSSDTAIAFHQYNNYYDALSAVVAFSLLTPIIHSFDFDSAVGKNYYLNGINKTLTSSGSGFDANKGLVSFAGATIGQSGVDSNYFKGDIAEIIVFNKLLSHNERKDVEGYLSKKWGI